MTKRKPLEWIELDEDHEIPNCMDCLDWLSQPGMAEAIASVGIERGGNVGIHAVEQYHANRHREPA